MFLVMRLQPFVRHFNLVVRLARQLSVTARPALRRVAGLALIGLLAGAAGANAQVSYSVAASTYTQTFSAPSGLSFDSHAWTDNSTYAGWYAASYNSNANTWSTPGSFYATNGINGGSTDFRWYRAGDGSTSLTLGAQVTDAQSSGTNGSSGAYYGVEIRNDTGSALTGFTLSYQVEMWRQASGSAPVQNTLVAAYRVTDAAQSFSVLDGWSLIDGSSYTTPKGGTGTGSLESINGKDPENIVTFSDLVVDGLSIADGQSLWIRWFDVNNSGVDHGIGLDNVAFSATAIPEPGTTAALTGIGVLAFALLQRRRRHG